MNVTLFDPVPLLPTRKLRAGMLILWARRQAPMRRHMLPTWRLAALMRTRSHGKLPKSRPLARRVLRYRGRRG